MVATIMSIHFGSTANSIDLIVAAYERDVDQTLLRENLRLTVEQRFDQFESFMRGLYALRGAAGPTRDPGEAQATTE
jgi:hypothetical protein